MKKLAYMAAAAALTVALPAAAAEVGTGVDAGASTSSSMKLGANTASGSASANFGSAVSAINNSEMAAQKIRTLSQVDAVTIVDLDTLAKGNNDKAALNAQSRNQAQIDDLRAAIESNDAVSSAIEMEDPEFDLSSVVAADVSADGTLVLYTRS